MSGSRGENADGGNGRDAALRRPVVAARRPYHRKTNFRAFTAADPISLERFDRIRPIQAFELVEQPIGKGGDAQHPLPHRAPHDRKAADLALSVDDFFVRQDGAQLRTPIHRHLRHIGEAHAVGIVAAIGGNGFRFFRLGIEPRIVDLEENPLRPFVVGGIGRVYFTFPIVGKADAFELRLEFRHVLARGDGWMLPGLDRVLLGRETECIPAHRVKNIEAAQAFVARDDVRGGVTLGMSHVEPGAARIGEHIEHVKLRFRRIEIFFAGIRCVEGTGLIPPCLPLRLDLIERIWFAALVHAERIRNTGKQERN